MKQRKEADKPRLQGLYGLAYSRLESISKKDIIPFPVVFSKICSPFSIQKKDAWEIIFLFRDCGLLEIIPGHGVRIK